MIRMGQYFLGFYGKFLLAGGWQRQFQWEVAQNFPCVWWSQWQMPHSPLAKAEPISEGVNASGITELKKGEATVLEQLAAGERMCESDSSQSVKKEEEVLQVMKEIHPCSIWRSTMREISTCSPWRTQMGAGADGWSRWMPRGGYDCGKPMVEPNPGSGPVARGAYPGAGLLPGFVTLQGTCTGGVCFWRTAASRRDLHWTRGRFWGVLPLRRKDQQKWQVMTWP